jgi:hypothetical protein
LDGRNGAAIWCDHGVFAHNLVKITTLPANQQARNRLRVNPAHDEDFFRSK